MGGGEIAVANIHASGRLSARERIDLLFDKGTFVELDKFVSHRCKDLRMEDLKLACDGVITGYGKVKERIVYVFAQDFCVKGGTLGEMHANKIEKCINQAICSGHPVIGLNDSEALVSWKGLKGLSDSEKSFTAM
jgi:acetyl-CoA carboxylase carboxyltransferase component